MVKGLEALKALERMTSDHSVYDDYTSEKFEADYKLVKSALKRLDELEKAFDSLSKDDEKAKRLLSLEIEKNEVLEIIYDAPSIIEQLFKLGQLGKKAEDRYYWGTITDSRVEKVKGFFADGKRDQSK